MKRKYPIFITLLSMVSLPAHSQKSVSLGDILDHSNQALAVMKAKAAKENKQHQLNKEQSEDGLSMFSSIGYGRIRDVVDVNRTRTYNQALAKFGLRYPLLGSAEAEAQDIHRARGELNQAQVRQEAAQYLAGLELEASYARYWEAQEHLEVINAYLESEPRVKRILQIRRDQDLILESQMLSLLSAYDKARVDKRKYESIRDNAARRLTQLTNKDFGQFDAQLVNLKPLPAINKDQVVNNNAELRAAQAKTEALQAQIDESNWHGINANLELSTSVVRDTTGQQTGGGLYAGVNVSAPLTFFSARKSAIQELKAEKRMAMLDYREEVNRIIREAQSSKGEFQQYMQTVKFTETRTNASAEALRERYLRSDVMENVGVEAISENLEQYYTLANNQIEAYGEAWQAHVQSRLYFQPGTGGTTSAPSPAAELDLGEKLSSPIEKAIKKISQRSTSNNSTNQFQSGYIKYIPAADHEQSRLITADYNPMRDGGLKSRTRFVNTSNNTDKPLNDGLSIYLWNSKELITQKHSSPGFWKVLEELSVNKLLVSLNAQQIQDAVVEPNNLKKFLNQAKDNDIKVELLLGEPSWIKPDRRQHLVSIIRSLSDYDFDGLHLDIEPNQLYELPLSRGKFDQWVDTMAAAAEASPWPVNVSTHHRYFREEPYTTWNLAQDLNDAGINNVTLMIYNSTPESVANIARPILERYNNMEFYIAQSVEKILSPKLSHFHRTPSSFEHTMAGLDELMDMQRNYAGIIIQDWNNLLKIGYESKIL